MVKRIETNLKKYFDAKFAPPKDFIGLDLTHNVDQGKIKLSMQTYTEKVQETFKLKDTNPILTPGRTDRKIIRGQDPLQDPTYRSKVGSLMWATMGIRYDIVYIVKELSRVLQEPTKIALELLQRTLTYITQTKEAHLLYDHEKMTQYTLPPTRKKPLFASDNYDVQSYNIQDHVPHNDDTKDQQDYTYNGTQLHVSCYTDIELGG